MVGGSWTTKALGSVATLQRGFDLPSRLRKPGEVPIVTSSGIEDKHCEAKVKAPGVVTGRYGTIGEVFFVETDFWPLNTTLYVRDFHGNDPLFISYLLRTIDFHTHSGKSGVPGVNRNDLHEIAVQLPPTTAEQEAIAEALSDADALIESLEQLVAKKRQLKQGTMQELLTGKRRLPGFEVKRGYKQTEVGVIPEDWEVAPVGLYLRRTPSYGINAPAIPFDSRFPTYLRITDISADGRFMSATKASVGHSAASSYLLEPGDLVFARTGASVGKSYLYNPEDGDLVFAGFLIRLSPNPERLIPGFLSFYAQSRPYWNWVKVNSMRSGQPGINGREYASLPICLPPKRAEQEAIAGALSDMDAEVAALEAKLAKARQIKQGMMQELLTGRIRLV